jgi:hypothetical protein
VIAYSIIIIWKGFILWQPFPFSIPYQMLDFEAEHPECVKVVGEAEAFNVIVYSIIIIWKGFILWQLFPFSIPYQMLDFEAEHPECVKVVREAEEFVE